MANTNLWDENGQPITNKITVEDWDAKVAENGLTLEQQMEILKAALLKNGVKPCYWGIKQR